jgi:hypothetical protein
MCNTSEAASAAAADVTQQQATSASSPAFTAPAVTAPAVKEFVKRSVAMHIGYLGTAYYGERGKVPASKPWWSRCSVHIAGGFRLLAGFPCDVAPVIVLFSPASPVTHTSPALPIS